MEDKQMEPTVSRLQEQGTKGSGMGAYLKKMWFSKL